MPIKRILVANRGEIARRVFRTCRELGISTVAIYSDADADAPHTAEADEAVLLPGSAPTDTYLKIEAVLQAAIDTGADAIHPGYGFLSENAAFATAVLESGLNWIGPTPASIEVMGSKLESKVLMDSVGVPTVPSLDLDGVAHVENAAREIGFPILVKASAGGGGKGMRVVEQAADLAAAIESARREATAAFGDGTVFLEKYLEAPRHIEVQVFGDSHGNVISLNERECSIQRRHQKIIEESPSPAVDDRIRAAIGDAAKAAARAVDYVGAGTVEFLFQDGEFFFLEMNTRLQVEHPVTEMVTGLDLVRLQIDVASGEQLDTKPVPISGHAIEARLYAEDPLNDFLPVTGQLHRFDFNDTPGLRVDSGVESGSEISVHYDPMIAKVIAHAPNREAAAALLASELRHARIHGSTTNRALLVRTLEHPRFLSGDTDTHFLDDHDVAELGRPLGDPVPEHIAAIAAALSDQAAERNSAPRLATLPSGWRNAPTQFQHRAYSGVHAHYEIFYTTRDSGFDVEGIGHVSAVEAQSTQATFTIDNDVHRALVARYGGQRYVDAETGPVVLEALPRFPAIEKDDATGSLHAPMPGTITRIDVTEGQEVAEGQVLVVMEAMKMEHTLRSPHAGVVTSVRYLSGDQVEADAVLVTVEDSA